MLNIRFAHVSVCRDNATVSRLFDLLYTGGAYG